METNLFDQAVGTTQIRHTAKGLRAASAKKVNWLDLLAQYEDLNRTRPVFIYDDEKHQGPVMKESSHLTLDANAPEGQYIPCTGPNVFTIPPEQLSPEEFARYEARTVAYLEENLNMRAREEQTQDPWAPLTEAPAATEPRTRPHRPQPVPVKSIKSSARRRHEVIVTTLTLLTVLLMFGLLIGAAILMRGA